MLEISEQLNSRWTRESAIEHAKLHFNCRAGLMYPAEGYEPTPKDMDAIAYLVMAHGFGYSPTTPKEAGSAPDETPPAG